jgi:hypothetical protein
MSDEELVKRPLDEEFDTMMEVQRDPYGAWQAIQTLTEQLEAARADAKEAEAYAEELAGGKALRRISPSDLHAVFARRDEWAYVSPMDEGNCVTLDGDFNFSQIAEDINAALAEIEGEKG